MNWQLISFFGDSTVLLPSAAALFIVLMLRKTSRLLAWQWSLLFGITGAIVCASKLAFMGWGLGIRELDYTGFSGHSALSAAFWPIFLWLLSARFSAGLQKAAVAAGYILAAVVGYSRLVIHAHSVSEVIAGLLLGAAGSALFLLLQKRTPIRKACVFPGAALCAWRWSRLSCCIAAIKRRLSPCWGKLLLPWARWINPLLEVICISRSGNYHFFYRGN